MLELYEDLGKEIPREAIVDETIGHLVRFDLLAKPA